MFAHNIRPQKRCKNYNQKKICKKKLLLEIKSHRTDFIRLPAQYIRVHLVHKLATIFR